MSKLFRVDNQLIQWSPSLFGPRQPGGTQLALPGLDKPAFGPFDEWAAYGLYALLDPKTPAEPVRTTPTRLLEVLGFAREFSSALYGYNTFPSDGYQLVEEALQRLYSVEVERQGLWNVRKPGKIRGRPKKQFVIFKGRILISYALIYPEGVTPPQYLPANERENINKAFTLTGEAGPAIWKRKDIKPSGIEYRIHPDLVRGLTGEDPHIGFTTFPFKIFDLRSTFIKKPTATRLLVWTLRQTSQTLSRDLDGLANELNLDTRRVTRTRDTLLNAFDLVRQAGILSDLRTVTDETSGRITVKFTRSDDWYLELPEEGMTTGVIDL